jgi:hypothetical protein
LAGGRWIDHQSIWLLHIKIQQHVVKTMGRKSALASNGRADTALERAIPSILGVSKTAFREQNPGTADNKYSEGTKLRELANQKDRETLLE